MFQISPLEKYYKNKSIIDKKLAIKFRDSIYPMLLALSKSKVKYTIVKDNQFQKIEGHPIIIATNHTRFQDTPIVCQILKDVLNERGYILAGKQKLGLLDNLFFWGYGSVFVDRKNEEDQLLYQKYGHKADFVEKKGTAVAQCAMEEYLKKGKPMITFPEATWNLEDSLLMLPTKWGNCKMSQNVNAQIIPWILDYDDNNMECHVTFGTPRIISPDADIKEENEIIRAEMALTRYEYIKGKQNNDKRSELDIPKEKEKKLYPVKEYPNYNLEYEQSTVFHPYASPEEVFEPIKKLRITKKNAFLFHKNNIGMR